MSAEGSSASKEVPPLLPFSSLYFHPQLPLNGPYEVTNEPHHQVLDLRTAVLNKALEEWSAEEESRLTQIVGESAGQSIGEIAWPQIAESLNSQRSVHEIFAHFVNVSDPTINKHHWDAEEEKHLLELAKKYEEHEWTKIAAELNTGRTPFECLRHYQQALNTRLVNGTEWTKEEDILLRDAVFRFGESWSHIAGCVPCRTVSQCRNRWHKLALRHSSSSSSTKRKAASSEWTTKDERRLFLSIMAHEIKGVGQRTFQPIVARGLDSEAEPGPESTAPANTETSSRRQRSQKRSNWTSVSKFVPGKDDVQCREKWTNNLDPTISHAQFSVDEDNQLLALVEELGLNAWTKIAKHFPGRTDGNVRHRYVHLTSSQPIPKRGRVLPQRYSRSTSAAITENDFSLQKRIEWNELSSKNK